MMNTGDASAEAGKSSRWRHPANRHLDRRRREERIADRVTRVFGSWRFIVVQTMIVTAWIALNLLAVAYRWDSRCTAGPAKGCPTTCCPGPSAVPR
jgi:uncharacterized membrane protein